jgi:hypothetical protein
MCGWIECIVVVHIGFLITTDNAGHGDIEADIEPAMDS